MKAYIFDLDGTLIDSMPYFAKTMLGILDEHGISYGEDMVKTVTPLGYLGTAEYFISLGVRKTADELVRRMLERITVEYERNIPLKHGVAKGLAYLKDKGLSLNILTASPHALLDPCIKRLGVYGLFDNVWSSDDFGKKKSEPEIYELTAKKLGIEVGDVCMVDDNLTAIRAARSAGLHTLGVYDESSEDLVLKMRSTADGYLIDFSEIVDFEQ